MNHSKREAKGSWLGSNWRVVKGRMCRSHRAVYKIRAALLLRDNQLLWNRLFPPNEESSYDWHSICAGILIQTYIFWEQHMFCVASMQATWFHPFLHHVVTPRTDEGNLGLITVFQLLSTLFLSHQYKALSNFPDQLFVSLVPFCPFRLGHVRRPLQSSLRFWCDPELRVVAGPDTLQAVEVPLFLYIARFLGTLCLSNPAWHGALHHCWKERKP